MSNEPEDVLEEALRGDLPTPDVEARVRRRLLAAGVAVGNGVAASTAAASGAAGVAVKAAGLSWGLKLGFVALVGIPTVGLWLDGRAPRGAPAPVARSAQPAPALPQPTVEATPNAPRTVTAPATPATVERPLARATKAPTNDSPRPTNDSPRPTNDRPSQADFAAADHLARAPQAPSTLAEETRLLDAAFAALTAGNRARAATLLQEHERRFPAGLLQHERERAKTRLTELSRGE